MRKVRAVQSRVAGGGGEFEVGFCDWGVWWNAGFWGLEIEVKKSDCSYGCTSYGDFVQEILYMSFH